MVIDIAVENENGSKLFSNCVEKIKYVKAFSENAEWLMQMTKSL